MFITANDVDVPVTSLNSELNVPLIVLQGHLGKIEEDTWDMSDRTPYSAMKYRMNEGLGASGEVKKRIPGFASMTSKDRSKVAATVSGSLMKAARKRATIAAKTLKGSGLGFWNPLSLIFPPAEKITDLSKFPPEDIKDLMAKLNVARWELESAWTEELIAAKITEMKAGLDLLPSGEPFKAPLKPPEVAAQEAFTSGVVDTTMSALETVQDRAGALVSGVGDVLKWLPWIAGGVAALYLAPQIIKTVKSARS